MNDLLYALSDVYMRHSLMRDDDGEMVCQDGCGPWPCESFNNARSVYEKEFPDHYPKRRTPPEVTEP